MLQSDRTIEDSASKMREEENRFLLLTLRWTQTAQEAEIPRQYFLLNPLKASGEMLNTQRPHEAISLQCCHFA